MANGEWKGGRDNFSLLATRYSPFYFHTSLASSTIIASFAHCCSSERTLPSSVEANPHCGERHNCAGATNLEASPMRRLRSSFLSSAPSLDETRPSTICLL